MKRTVFINLYGTVYTIDEDAHQLLEQYLNNMKSYFSRQAGGEEIADDIEHRVAELFWDIREKGNSWDSITIEQVKEIIQKVGNPEQMTEPDEGALPTKNPDTEANEQQGEEAQASSTANEGLGGWLRNRRFFRDPQDKRVGGVISGACHYFGIQDPLVWRLGYALVCFLAVVGDWPFFLEFFAHIIRWSIIFYLFIWMIAPEANSAEDRLRMKGKAVNPDSINDELLNAHGVYDNNEKPLDNQAKASGCLSGFTDVIAICVKALLIIIGIGMAIAFIFPIVALIALICNMPLLGNIFGFSSDMLQTVSDDRTSLILLVIALITLVALPIYALCRWLMKTDKPLSAGISALLIVLWVIALGFTMFYGINIAGKTLDNVDYWKWEYTYLTDEDSENANRFDVVAPFSVIEVEGVGTVTFRQNDSEEYTVACNGPQDLLNDTEIHVEDGVLKIQSDDSGRTHQRGLEITITSPSLTSAKMQGVGCLQIADTVRVGNPVELSLEGVGSLKADYIEASRITASNEGVGSSQINVKCDSLFVTCQGVGAIKVTGETHFYKRNQADLLGRIKDSGLKVIE